MQTYHKIKDLKDELHRHRHQVEPKRIALVATMGNLHAGHLSLVKLAQQHADIVVVSIFVNPTQFGVGEDFDSYPRTLEADLTQLKSVGVDFVFAPSIDEMYPVYPPNVQVLSGDMTKILCGKTRPTHFDGVGLVVGKLFNIVRPDVAVFGKKDYQQLAIIRQLNDELNFGIEIIGAPIVRSDDGLALSSRNQYLSAAQRAIAPMIQETLQDLKTTIMTADFSQYPSLVAAAINHLNANGAKVDYLELRNQQLEMPSREDKRLVLLTACYVGSTRLLDNLEIQLS